MKKNDIEKTDLSVLSDGEFTAEIFARAKRKKAAARKRVLTAVISVCSACFVFIFVGIGIASLNGNLADGDYSPAPSTEVGYTDYVLYNGQYVSISKGVSSELKKIISYAEEISDDDFSDGEYVFENSYIAVIDGVRYVFFDGGLSYKTKLIKNKDLGKRAVNLIKTGL